MKQYIKDKRKRWGYKIWCLVSQNYLFRFEVYSEDVHPMQLDLPLKS